MPTSTHSRVLRWNYLVIVGEFTNVRREPRRGWRRGDWRHAFGQAVGRRDADHVQPVRPQRGEERVEGGLEGPSPSAWRLGCR
jgi:hypothetical protein